MVPSRLEIVLIDFEGECDFKYLNLVISLSDPCVEQFWKLRHLYLGQLNLVCHVELVFSSAPSLKKFKDWESIFNIAWILISHKCSLKYRSSLQNYYVELLAYCRVYWMVLKSLCYLVKWADPECLTWLKMRNWPQNRPWLNIWPTQLSIVAFHKLIKINNLNQSQLAVTPITL